MAQYERFEALLSLIVYDFFIVTRWLDRVVLRLIGFENAKDVFLILAVNIIRDVIPLDNFDDCGFFDIIVWPVPLKLTLNCFLIVFVVPLYYANWIVAPPILQPIAHVAAFNNSLVFSNLRLNAILILFVALLVAQQLLDVVVVRI